MAIRTLQDPALSTRPLFVGRRREVAALVDWLAHVGAPVAFVQGVAGIGKSALIATFAREAAALGHAPIYLDCGLVEPTQRGFLGTLGAAIGAEGSPPTLEQVSERLKGRGPSVIVLDDYDVLRLLDTWLRQVFVAALPGSARLLIAGREDPIPGWLTAWSPLVLRVEPLSRPESVELLRELDVSEALAGRIADKVHGHPLALTLAASTARDRPDLGVEDIATHHVVGALADLYLDGIEDPLIRETLEAASVVRRINVGLLEAMVPAAPARECYERLRSLPFVESRHDGLVVHEAVRDAIAASVKAADPARYRDYRRKAWRHLRDELRDATPAELWRFSADLVYLFENPAVREAYFPSGAQPLAVEPARIEDWPSIARIAERHLDAEERRIVERWWTVAPHNFEVERDRDSVVVAFLILVDGKSLMPLAVPEDPVVRQWSEDLRSDPLGRGQIAQGLRLWLDADHADAPSSAQAAGFLDCKRSYMALRPRLARMYLSMRDPATYWPILEQLEFRQLERGPVHVGSSTYTTGRLDFGAGSVDGWLARLVGAELGLDERDPLDPTSRQLAMDGRRVQLSRLECGVVESLARRTGRVVTRRQLIEDVWGYEFDGGSNIVDSVVRTLRRKLGPHGGLVETVRGVGYRLPQGWESQLG